jgi:O-antigen ligase
MVSELLSYSVFFNLIHIKNVSPQDPSVFMHHTLYSVFLAFTVGILVDRILSSDTLKHKLIYIFFSLTITANLFINAGRTGQVIFIFVLISVLLSKSHFNYKAILATLFISTTVFYTAFLYSPNFQHRMQQTIQSIKHISYNTPIGSRIGLDIIAKDIFIKNPILGVGAGDYLSKKAEVIDTKYKSEDMHYVKSLVHYHNQFAEFAVIAGIFGLLAYIMIWIAIMKIDIKDNHIKTIKYILITSFVLASLTDAMFHLNRPLSLFALFIGLILAQKKYEQQEPIEAS